MVVVVGQAHPEGLPETYNGYYLKQSEIDGHLPSMPGIPVFDEHDPTKFVGEVFACVKGKNGEMLVAIDIPENTPQQRTTAESIRSGKYKGLSLGCRHRVNPNTERVMESEVMEVSVCGEGDIEGTDIYTFHSKDGSTSEPFKIEWTDVSGVQVLSEEDAARIKPRTVRTNASATSLSAGDAGPFPEMVAFVEQQMQERGDGEQTRVAGSQITDMITFMPNGGMPDIRPFGSDPREPRDRFAAKQTLKQLSADPAMFGQQPKEPGIDSVVDDTPAPAGTGPAEPAPPRRMTPAPKASAPPPRRDEHGRFTHGEGPASGRGYEEKTPEKKGVSFEDETRGQQQTPMEEEGEGRGHKRKAPETDKPDKGKEREDALDNEDASVKKSKLDSLLAQSEELKKVKARLEEEQKLNRSVFEDFKEGDEASLEETHARWKKAKGEILKKEKADHRAEVARYLNDTITRFPKVLEILKDISEEERRSIEPSLRKIKKSTEDPAKLYESPDLFKETQSTFRLVDTVASRLEKDNARNVGRISALEAALKKKEGETDQKDMSYQKLLQKEKAKEKALLGSAASPENRQVYTPNTPKPTGSAPTWNEQEVELAKEYALKPLPTNVAYPPNREAEEQNYMELLDCPVRGIERLYHQDPYKYYKPAAGLWNDINKAMNNPYASGNSMRFAVPGLTGYDYGKDEGFFLSDSEHPSEHVYTLASRTAIV